MSFYSTTNNGSLGSQIFLSIASLVAAWLLFFQDYSVLDTVRIQAPITFIEPAAAATATATAAAADAQETKVSIATILASMRPKTDAMDVLEKERNTPRALYIAKYYKTAVDEMKKFGIPASITLAQGILESNAGQSKLAKVNNHFGIKCFSTRCKGGHCTNMADDSHKDFFIKYKSPWESFRAHSLLLTGKNYQRCLRCDNDYKCWAGALKKCGYATSTTYSADLIRIIELYELDKLDRL